MARVLTPAAFRQQVAAGRPDAVYLLTGPDHDLKTELTNLLVDRLDEGLRAFNLDRIHIADSRPEARRQIWALVDLARTLPMMSDWRLIVVPGAERLVLALKKPEGAREEWAELDALERWLSAPEPGAVVVFLADGLDGRAKASKVLEAHATVVECDPLANDGDGTAWIKAEAAREQVRIEPSAVRLLVSLAGHDSVRLRQEFERALLFASGDGIITEAAVREVAAGPGLRDPWAMVNAIERGDTASALRELALKLDRGRRAS